ncbi:heparan-alpha-glucosaminide N-acetyltransferase domain-containing protein [Microbacterium sp. EF45047]|uniref:heparan-alpha-glucosaminide N-acetyltransferase domain-containing protein n=1 Tax=Microbacterium sp. EF45047 TaxID=2809708 RepID=UPI00234A7F69|nr:heparan-alpha-glucosaminide N-acetyltransferase domain-containing protein [Microbacterium sp. EF45047]WCM55121.1 DUF1624 domain-containing protein [Microbacterium sp. EF45047]
MTSTGEPGRADAAASWLRTFGRPPRIMGLDVARAVAILGMIGAHLGDVPDAFRPDDPDSWGSVVHGHPSVLFAVLAGVSVALMTGGPAGPAPERLPSLRLGLVGRGATIFTIGLLLELLNTPIAVILTLYGVLYVALIPVLRWRTGSLFAAAAVLALAGPVVTALIGVLALGPSGQAAGFVLYGSYPLTVWLAYALAGMALGRLGMDRAATAWWMLAGGVLFALAGHGLGAIGRMLGVAEDDARPPVDAAFRASGWEGWLDAVQAADPGRVALAALLSVDPHSGGTADILAAAGIAAAVIGLCLRAAQPLRLLLLPFAALGSMPLSAYTLHVISYVLMAGPGGFLRDNGIWLVSALVLLLGATLWSILSGRGPLERLTAAVARAAASVPTR